eukprot:gene17876-22055_t
MVAHAAAPPPADPAHPVSDGKEKEKDGAAPGVPLPDAPPPPGAPTAKAKAKAKGEGKGGGQRAARRGRTLLGDGSAEVGADRPIAGG